MPSVVVVLGTAIFARADRSLAVLGDHALIAHDGALTTVAPRAAAAPELRALGLPDALCAAATDAHAWWAEHGAAETAAALWRERGVRVEVLAPTQFVLPGLIDAHVHASQFCNSGCSINMPLLDWLTTYTFPEETHFADTEYAARVYSAFIDMLLAHGTTTGCIFATIHREASAVLAKLCAERGMRALVGKVNMDRNSPDSYCETTASSLAETEAFVKETLALGSPLVAPVITPRFVPTCSSELMRGLSDIATRYGVSIQSHVSENLGEIAWVEKELHPGRSYMEVYDDHGLLGPRTLLAHGVHLTDRDLDLLRARGTSIVHCPLSNFTLVSGVCDVVRLLDAGVEVGLGTDVGGGASPSMLSQMRYALIANQTLYSQQHVSRQLTPGELLFLATRGSARCLNLHERIGAFEVGMQLDALVVDMAASERTVCEVQRARAATIAESYAPDSRLVRHMEDLFLRFVQLGDDRNVRRVFVAGRVVHDADVAASA